MPLADKYLLYKTMQKRPTAVCYIQTKSVDISSTIILLCCPISFGSSPTAATTYLQALWPAFFFVVSAFYGFPPHLSGAITEASDYNFLYYSLYCIVCKMLV